MVEASLFNNDLTPPPPRVASDDDSTFVKLRQSGSDIHAREGASRPLFVSFCTILSISGLLLFSGVPMSRRHQRAETKKKT